MSYRYRLGRAIHEKIAQILDFVVFYLLFPGTAFYWIVEKAYLLTFDRYIRQQSAIDPSAPLDWENPLVIGRKRRKAHAAAQEFRCRSLALKHGKEKVADRVACAARGSDLLMLTGDPGCPDDSTTSWDFLLVGDPLSCPLGWEAADFPASSEGGWRPMLLPSHWQLQGYDVPLYTNTSYPFRFDPPRARREGTWTNAACDLGLGCSNISEAPLHRNEPGFNATGLYRRKVALPADWCDSEGALLPEHRVFLVFEGVDSCLSIWVNGEFVGYGQDSCLPHEYDITSVLSASRNEHCIAAKVSRWCDGSYLEDQDKWWLSGIYREAYLIRRPRQFISDFEFRSELTFERDECTAHFSVGILAEEIELGVSAVRCELWQEEGSQPCVQLCQTIESGGSALQSQQLADRFLIAEAADLDLHLPVGPGVVELRSSLRNPKLWSAETPMLYTMVITLYGSLRDAELATEGCHSVTHRVGFRSVCFGGEGHVLMVNNKAITVAGVNRHEFDPELGRAVSRASMLTDALMLKSMSMNAVRTAHYPNHPFWLEVCDEVGLYVIDEANIESHGFQALGQPIGYLSNQEGWRSSMASRVTRMVERDKNHSSVIGWSLGNESGYGPTHELLAQWVRARDKSRFVQYESGGARTSATDIICPMYQRPKWCVEQAISDGCQRPVILCEYAHAMGNSGGCLGKYWGHFRDPAVPRLQGGFIWDFADQGLRMKGSEGFKYGGDFGELPNTHNFCCNGLVAPDRSPYPTVSEVKLLQCPVQLTWISQEGQFGFSVENHRSFEDLSDIFLVVTPLAFVSLWRDAVMCGSFELECGAVPPSGRRALSLTPHLEEVWASAKLRSCQAQVTLPLMEALDQEVSPCAWLDVAVMQRHPSQPASSEATELTHYHFQDRALCEFMLEKTIDRASASTRAIPALSNPSIEETAEAILVHFENGSTISVRRSCGRICSWLDVDRNELLVEPVDLCLYRAPTDNDLGGSLFSFAARWEEAGYHNLIRDDSIPVSTTVLSGSEHVRISTSWTLKPCPAQNMEDIGIRIPCRGDYEVYPHGAVKIRLSVAPPSYLPPLPRVGLRTALPESFCRVQWMGRGPHEAYDDRKASAYLGIFQKEVEELHTPYMRPQENGRRADPRWIKFVRPSSESCLVAIPISVSDHDGEACQVEGFGFNASRFSLEQLSKSKHDEELAREKDAIHIHIDSRSMGVGGYDSWSPNVDNEFLIRPTGEWMSVAVVLAVVATQPSQ